VPHRLQIATFAYHDVTDAPEASGFQRAAALPYKLPVAAFRQHLDAIAAGPCRPTLITEVDLTRGGRHVLLTVDDGGRSAMVAAEELSRRGWRGHFFVTTGRLGSPGFLDAAAVRDLHAAGHLIGSHSHTHPDIFRELRDGPMRVEWVESVTRLRDITGAACVAASVPGGDMSDRVHSSAAAAGVRYLFTSDPTLTPNDAGGCWVLGRFCPKVGTDPGYIERLARFEAWRRALLVRQLKELTRRAFPGLYRAYVRYGTSERDAQDTGGYAA
jgi:peptidoglycan/xylan/chitin deacetylase (PgdA/CDA1 family)